MERGDLGSNRHGDGGGRPRSRLLRLLATLVLGAACAGCVEADDTLASSLQAQRQEPSRDPDLGLLPGDPDVLLQAPDVGGDRVISDLRNQGSAVVDVIVSVLDGGALRTEQSQRRIAFRTPVYSADDDSPPRAIISVRPGPSSGDALSPGGARFAYGAEFMLDAESRGTEVDNGDNLVQRGLAGDSAQYKLEIDGGRPGCVVTGSSGSLQVIARVTADPGVWYRARCSRDGESLTVDVVEFRADGRDAYSSRTTTGPLGDVTMGDARTPLSVGGKLAKDGTPIRTATDQFNGLITNAVLAIAD